MYLLLIIDLEVFPTLEIIGFYSNRPLQDQLQLYNIFIQLGQNDQNIALIFDKSSVIDGQLPIKLYEFMNNVPILTTYKIDTPEVERIALDQFKESQDEEDSGTRNLKLYRNAILMMQKRIGVLQNYVQQVTTGFTV